MRHSIMVAVLAAGAAVAWGQETPDGPADADPALKEAPARRDPEKTPEPKPQAPDEAEKPDKAEQPDKARESDKPEQPDKAKPGDKPARAPKAARSDDVALREALKTLAKALQEGKADGIKQVIHADNATERKMVDAMAAMAVQIAKLHQAAVKAFGEEQAKGLTGDLVAEMKRIDDADVSIDGDSATVRYKPDEPATDGEPAPPPPASIVLKKVDGRWQVPMAELSRDATAEGIEQRLADLDAQTKVITELAAEIAKGKYRSADKAAEAWQSKMMQALTPGKKPKAGKNGGDEAGKTRGGKGSGEGDSPSKDRPKDEDAKPQAPTESNERQ